MRFDHAVPQQTQVEAQPPIPNYPIGTNLELIGEDDNDVTYDPMMTTPPQPPQRYPDRTRHPPSRYDEYLRHSFWTVGSLLEGGSIV